MEYFEAVDDGTPVRLTTEALEQREPRRLTTPLMTYDFHRFQVRAARQRARVAWVVLARTLHTTPADRYPDWPDPTCPAAPTFSPSRQAGAPSEELFRMASSSMAPIFAGAASLAVGECERVVQDMGFPYIHFVHTYYYA